MDVEYVQIRQHTKDRAVQNDLHLSWIFAKTNEWTVVIFRFSFEKECMSIFIEIFPVLRHSFIFELPENLHITDTRGTNFIICCRDGFAIRWCTSLPHCILGWKYSSVVRGCPLCRSVRYWRFYCNLLQSLVPFHNIIWEQNDKNERWLLTSGDPRKFTRINLKTEGLEMDGTIFRRFASIGICDSCRVWAFPETEEP